MTKQQPRLDLKGFIILLLIVVLILLVYIVIIARSEAGECYMDPFKYGAKKMSAANGAEFRGTGSFDTPNSAILYFDQYNHSVVFPATNRREDINFTKAIKDFEEGIEP